jgi:hypothetical protein
MDLFFVIPTYRLRDVGETVEHYDEHFWRNGHSVRMIVFDDSSPANQEKYYPLLEKTHTHVAGAAVDLLLVRHENDVGVNVLRREGDVLVTVVK